MSCLKNVRLFYKTNIYVTIWDLHLNIPYERHFLPPHSYSIVPSTAGNKSRLFIFFQLFRRILQNSSHLSKRDPINDDLYFGNNVKSQGVMSEE